jgi:hypothetical protein
VERDDWPPDSDTAPIGPFVDKNTELWEPARGVNYYALLLLLQWGETMSAWNWVANGPIVNPADDTWVNMEQQWNDTDRGKLKDSEKNLSQRHFMHHKSHMDWPGCESGPPQWEAGS